MDNMRGKTVVVTGGNNGIGLGTVVGLAKMGAQVIMVARSREKGEQALAEAKARSGNGNISLMLADLSRQSDVRALAEQISRKYERLDVLINNAAIIPAERELSPDRVEMQFAVNHLAYFLLTNLLLENLKRAPQGRVISVSSSVHAQGKINFDDLQNERDYHMAGFPLRGWQQYSNTKLMNVLFTRELARRLAGTPVTANALHPGVIATGLTRTAPGIFNWLYKRFVANAEKGAETSIYLASSPDVAAITGGYFEDRKQVTPAPAAQDDAAARRLWDISAQMTGIASGEAMGAQAARVTA